MSSASASAGAARAAPRPAAAPSPRSSPRGRLLAPLGQAAHVVEPERDRAARGVDGRADEQVGDEAGRVRGREPDHRGGRDPRAEPPVRLDRAALVRGGRARAVVDQHREGLARQATPRGRDAPPVHLPVV